MSTYKILLGGYRESILVTSFEPSTAKFKTLSETKTPNCPSWIEKSLAKGSNVFHCVSESEKTPGLAFSFVLKGDEVKVTEQKETKGIPAHGGWIVFESVRGSTMGVVKLQLKNGRWIWKDDDKRVALYGRIYEQIPLFRSIIQPVSQRVRSTATDR